jgi:hypothetical protein
MPFALSGPPLGSPETRSRPAAYFLFRRLAGNPGRHAGTACSPPETGMGKRATRKVVKACFSCSIELHCRPLNVDFHILDGLQNKRNRKNPALT